MEQNAKDKGCQGGQWHNPKQRDTLQRRLTPMDLEGDNSAQDFTSPVNSLMSQPHSPSVLFCSYYRITQFLNAVNIWENTDKSVETLKQIIEQMREHEHKTGKGKSLFRMSPTIPQQPLLAP